MFFIIKSNLLLLLLLLLVPRSSFGFGIPIAKAASASAAVALKDHSGAAASLFGNMRTPAALIAGALVPLGILNSPPVQKGDSRNLRILKKAHALLAIASLLSEVICITHSTIAINKLAEVKVAPTSGVAELIGKHFELAWIGTNIQFLLGMFGFGLLVGARAFIVYGRGVGKIASCWSIAAFLQCLSIVNRGIAMGHGDVLDNHSRFAANLFTLVIRYIQLVVKNANGVLSFAALGILAYSIFLMVQGVVSEPEKEE